MDTLARFDASPRCPGALIDYPGFNLRLAPGSLPGHPDHLLHQPADLGVETGRIRTIAQLVRKMLVILPFEKAL